MSEPVNLYHWAAFDFGHKEIRLVGYTIESNQQRCIVTEPLMTINPKTGIVETSDDKTYKPLDEINIAHKIDMMYVLGRWIDLNIKGEPHEVTKMIAEELNKDVKNETKRRSKVEKKRKG